MTVYSTSNTTQHAWLSAGRGTASSEIDAINMDGDIMHWHEAIKTRPYINNYGNDSLLKSLGQWTWIFSSITSHYSAVIHHGNTYQKSVTSNQIISSNFKTPCAQWWLWLISVRVPPFYIPASLDCVCWVSRVYLQVIIYRCSFTVRVDGCSKLLDIYAKFVITMAICIR